MAPNTTVPTEEGEVVVIDRTGFDLIVARNEQAIREQFETDPGQILVSVQLEDDQIDHLNSGLMKRSRRLIPLPLLAELIARLIAQQSAQK